MCTFQNCFNNFVIKNYLFWKIFFQSSIFFYLILIATNDYCKKYISTFKLCNETMKSCILFLSINFRVEYTKCYLLNNWRQCVLSQVPNFYIHPVLYCDPVAYKSKYVRRNFHCFIALTKFCVRKVDDQKESSSFVWICRFIMFYNFLS